MRRLFTLFSIWLFQTGFAQPEKGSGVPSVSRGEIERISGFVSNYTGNRIIDIFFPEEYARQPEKRFPVLYMHDGQMLFDSSITWNHQEWGADEAVHEHFQKTGKSCIIVGVHNGGKNRYAEYFPLKPFMKLSPVAKSKIAALAEKDPGRQMKDSLPSSDQYLKFLVKELKPFIDQKYRTKREPASTFICGSSMGGLISMYAICEYPEVFGASAWFSTHWPGIFDDIDNPVPASFMEYLSSHAPSPAGHRIYMDCGTAGLDGLYPKYHLQAEKILKEKGYSKKNLISRVIQGADHNEQAWRARMPDILTFFLGK